MILQLFKIWGEASIHAPQGRGKKGQNATTTVGSKVPSWFQEVGYKYGILELKLALMPFCNSDKGNLSVE